MSEKAQAAPRPINALSAVSLVLLFPARTFERLRERPHWILPLLFVMAASMTSAVYAVRGGFMDEFISGFAIRGGAHPAEIESGLLAAAVIMAIAVVPIVALMEAFFFRVIGTAFGGRAPFRAVFSAVVHASVPAGVGALIFALVMPLTRSATAGANLAFLVDGASRPYWWSLARQVDLFSIWYFVLLGIAAEPLFGFPRKRARLAALTFALVYVAIMSWSGVGGATRFSDPYEAWATEETAEAVVRVSPSVDASDVEAVRAAATAARERMSAVTGLESGERITYYLYASLDEKERITGNVMLAHGVEWANVVHVVWGNEADVALAREAAKVIAAGRLGTLYNPFAREGLGVLVGETWQGAPVLDVASGFLAGGEMPPLEELLDPPRYADLRTGMARPIAGAFAGFLLARLGPEGYRGFLEETAAGVRAPEDVLERALGAPLDAIEGEWLEYVGAPAESGSDAASP